MSAEDKMDNDSSIIADDSSRDLENFLFHPPYKDCEIGLVNKILTNVVEGLVVTPLAADVEINTASRHDDDEIAKTDEEGCAAVMPVEQKLQHSPRTYQMELFEKVKKQNTIVHLGTGCGKTLIAILSIRHFLDQDSTRQALFIVPSVALAVQHSRTLQANLPYKVQMACSLVHYSEQMRKVIATAGVVVATHGAILDLYRHYGDLFNIKNVSLLIFDECHYAGTAKHGQALFMEEFYCRENGPKPRVLGLTASPIINLSKKKLKAEGGLSSQIDQLEITLDAEVAFLSSSKNSDEDNSGDDDDSSVVDLEDPLRQKIDEVLIEYDDSYDTGSEEVDDSQHTLPDKKKFRIHWVRKKEIDQLVKLHEELGPCVTEVYSKVLRNELSRDRYDGETDTQYKEMLRYLEELAEQCSKQRRMCPNKGRTNKLIQLEKLLSNLLSGCPNEDVGILFVEMRITALALHVYFQQLLRAEDSALKVRSDKLVRKATHLFKYLHRSHHVGSNCEKEEMVKQAEIEVEWRHQIDSIQNVLDRLRRKETDILIATSIVEEGVDVPACSFVIVFDGLKTIKGYIQMKGRARQKKAKLFVFNNMNPNATKPPVCLADAREAESLIGGYIEVRKKREYAPEAAPCRPLNGNILLGEEEALLNYGYSSTYGQVSIKSAKSLLNLYCQSIPIDSYSRSLRELLDVHMPRYSDYELELPAHLPAEKRTITLPETYHQKSKTFRHSALALMACVRLHKLNLLNDRLLPLMGKDMYQKLLSQTVSEFSEPIDIRKNLCLPSSDEDLKTIFMYPLIQKGGVFCQNDDFLQPLRKRRLSIIVPTPLPEIPRFCFAHAELGEVRCEMEEVVELEISSSDWTVCTQFFLSIMQGRWRRRTSRVHFSYKYDYGLGEVTPPCFVGAIDDDNNLDMSYMKTIIADYERTDEERRESTRNDGNMPRPRIWAPLYSPNSSYITFGPSHLNCDAKFPSDGKNYNSYADYMESTHDTRLNPTGRLFVSQRLWVLPNKMVELERGFKGNKRKYVANEGSSRRKPLNDGEEAYLDGLNAVLMPQDACMETKISDPALFLHLIFLPAFLYHLERYLIGNEFVLHCKQNLPFLEPYLSSDKVSMEDIMEALTAKSCTLKMTYDKLEYIGDAVLKLAQTDALLNSTQLRDWVSCLHEGHLTALRSALGCNSRLNDAAVSMSIDKFIMLVPLGRGMWLPSTLQTYVRVPSGETQQNFNSANYNLSVKVCADVIEAIIGLIFIRFGFSDAVKVINGLQISLETDTKNVAPRRKKYVGSSKIIEHAKSFLGKKTFNDESLLVEALTHPSCLHKDVPSYQKLEWVGDAVLCLMVREFVFKEYPQHDVGRLNLIEITLVCNESLAYLSVCGGLQGCINHENLSLPHRIRDFSDDISGKEQQSLWGTEPPKALADVVESLLGAAHIDGGYESGQNATAYVLRPMLTKVQRNLESSSSALAMMHPTQLMYEICGQTLKTRIWKEHEFASKHPGALVYRGSQFAEPNAHGDGSVCQVTCCGVQLLAVLDSRHHVARNRACALICAVFKVASSKLTLDLKRWFARNADINNKTTIRTRPHNAQS